MQNTLSQYSCCNWANATLRHYLIAGLNSFVLQLLKWNCCSISDPIQWLALLKWIHVRTVAPFQTQIHHNCNRQRYRQPIQSKLCNHTSNAAKVTKNESHKRQSKQYHVQTMHWDQGRGEKVNHTVHMPCNAVTFTVHPIVDGYPLNVRQCGWGKSLTCQIADLPNRGLAG